eukprot:UN2052
MPSASTVREIRKTGARIPSKRAGDWLPAEDRCHIQACSLYEVRQNTGGVDAEGRGTARASCATRIPRKDGSVKGKVHPDLCQGPQQLTSRRKGTTITELVHRASGRSKGVQGLWHSTPWHKHGARWLTQQGGLPRWDHRTPTEARTETTRRHRTRARMAPLSDSQGP